MHFIDEFMKKCLKLITYILHINDGRNGYRLKLLEKEKYSSIPHQ